MILCMLTYLIHKMCFLNCSSSISLAWYDTLVSAISRNINKHAQRYESASTTSMKVLRLTLVPRLGSGTLRRLHARSMHVATGGRRYSSGISSVKATPWNSQAKADQHGSQISKHVASTKQTAYIALGSNIGDRIGWIEKACNEMDARGIKITRTSSLWETKPMYVLDQNEFINGVCEVRADHMFYLFVVVRSIKHRT